MNNIYYTLGGLNRFIEKETKSGNGPIPGFSRMAIDFKHSPTGDILAAIKVFMYEDKTVREFHMPNSFSDFSKAITDGLVNIWKLSSRQKMLFVSFFNDRTCTGEFIKKASDAEEYLIKLQSLIPYVVKVLDEPANYDVEFVKEAQIIAKQFIEMNRRVINYRDYIKYARFEYNCIS